MFTSYFENMNQNNFDDSGQEENNILAQNDNLVLIKAVEQYAVLYDNHRYNSAEKKARIFSQAWSNVSDFTGRSGTSLIKVISLIMMKYNCFSKSCLDIN